ncbi:MAG: hypothetical protein BWY58_00092 [Chloroflexi bacterium ADurb.Bin344]|nr:MAG: hypothetical protein BWY58_00092 [Chloroflexi bacterium ADurb.Bin344]
METIETTEGETLLLASIMAFDSCRTSFSVVVLNIASETFLMPSFSAICPLFEKVMTIANIPPIIPSKKAVMTMNDERAKDLPFFLFRPVSISGLPKLLSSIFISFGDIRTSQIIAYKEKLYIPLGPDINIKTILFKIIENKLKN